MQLTWILLCQFWNTETNYSNNQSQYYWSGKKKLKEIIVVVKDVCPGPSHKTTENKPVQIFKIRNPTLTSLKNLWNKMLNIYALYIGTTSLNYTVKLSCRWVFIYEGYSILLQNVTEQASVGIKKIDVGFTKLNQ